MKLKLLSKMYHKRWRWRYKLLTWHTLLSLLPPFKHCLYLWYGYFALWDSEQNIGMDGVEWTGYPPDCQDYQSSCSAKNLGCQNSILDLLSQLWIKTYSCATKTTYWRNIFCISAGWTFCIWPGQRFVLNEFCFVNVDLIWIRHSIQINILFIRTLATAAKLYQT